MEHTNMSLKPTRKPDDVFFSVAQLKYLEENFPQVVLGPHSSEEAMRHYFGQQSVLFAVRNRTRGMNGDSKKSDTEHIPSPAG
jgi:hypothetical protein